MLCMIELCNTNVVYNGVVYILKLKLHNTNHYFHTFSYLAAVRWFYSRLCNSELCNTNVVYNEVV